MKEFKIRIVSMMRIFMIFFVVILAFIFSSLSLILNPSGNLSHKTLNLAARLILLCGGVKLIVEGRENVNSDKVQVFASNHSSHFDVPVLFQALQIRTGWVAKKELFSIPFLGWLMKANRYISIDRGDGRKAVKSLQTAVEKIKSGLRITIFPEGTRSPDGQLLPFKKMLFKLCLKTGVPVVPVYIEGSNNVLKPGSMIIRPGTVYVSIGKEINTDQYAANKAGELMDDFGVIMLKLQSDIREKIKNNK